MSRKLRALYSNIILNNSYKKRERKITKVQLFNHLDKVPGSKMPIVVSSFLNIANHQRYSSIIHRYHFIDKGGVDQVVQC